MKTLFELALKCIKGLVLIFAVITVIGIALEGQS